MKNPRKKIKKLFEEYEMQAGKNPTLECDDNSEKEETLWGYYVYGVYGDSGGGGGCCC